MPHLRLITPAAPPDRLAAVADPGALAILWNLAAGPLRTADLGRSARLGPSAAARRLRRLIGVGLVRRRVLGTVPPHVRYELSPDGADLVHATTALRRWATADPPGDADAAR